MLSSDVIRMAILIGAMGCNAAFAQLGRDGPYAPVPEAVRTGAYVVLWAAAYMGVYALWHRRPVTPDLPQLNLETVIIYVYGLGALAFVTAYTCLALSSICLLNFFVSAFCTCIVDVLHRPADSGSQRAAALVVAAFAVSAVVCVAAGEEDFYIFARVVERGDWGSILYGIVLPACAPQAIQCARQGRLSSPRIVFELLHLATPFAAITALIALNWLDAAPPPRAARRGGEGTPARWAYSNEPEPARFGLALLNATAPQFLASVPLAARARFLGLTPAQLVRPLLPLTSGLVLFFAVQSALLYSTVDFLAAGAFVSAAKHFAYRLPQPEAVWAMSFATVAFVVRLCASNACDEEPGPGPRTEGSPLSPIGEEDDFDMEALPPVRSGAI